MKTITINIGIFQIDSIKHTEVKNKVRSESIIRIKKILKSKLSGGNSIKAINTPAIAGILHRTQAELKLLIGRA